MEFRVGYGYDIHQFAEGKEMMLGGVKVTSPRGFLAHSDGDVLLHALCDALLGAAGLGDIGEHFPDSDPRFRGAASAELTTHLVGIVTGQGWRVSNADLTVVIQEPKMHPYKERIRQRVAELLGVDGSRVNVKAKTKEWLDAVGENRAAEAHAVVLIERNRTD
ncbi:MAG: 2-C-methyl-D-erythritol 2,4-cyclodiphosphate synthase [Planctomycetota bacterium]